MEFLAIDMVLTGLGPVSSAITAFMVNFRHIFYGLTYPRHVIRRGLPSAYATYALTDEVYAITSTLRGPATGARLLTITIVCQLAWVGAGIVGALAGAVIPPNLEGFDFALTALFAVLAVRAARIVPGQVVIVGLLSYFLVLVVRFWAPRIDDTLTWRLP